MSPTTANIIVIQTYKRPDLLNKTIHTILEGESRFIHSVIVAWNDLETPVPEDWASPSGIKVHFRQSEVNSLNEKLRPDPLIKTKGVLLGDDDTYYNQGDMESAFQVWRELGRGRLVGPWVRGSKLVNGKYQYTMPRGGLSKYTMVLTGHAFTHIAFMDYYHSDDDRMTKVRAYVDEHFNCEDIALNFLTTSLTGCPSMYFKGEGGAKMAKKPKGMPTIGTKKGHAQARSNCINDMKDFWGRMPLKESDSYLIRGNLRAP